MSQIEHWVRERPERLIVVPLSAAALVAVGLSLFWRVDFDAPLLLYVGHLIGLGHIPYRDIFDVNLPLSYLVNFSIVKFLGYHDLSFRVADLAILAAICTSTWLWLKELGRDVGICGAALFAVFYLNAGPLLTLQRDFLVILPISFVFWILCAVPREKKLIRYIGLGIFFGLAANIKPHALVGLPIILLVDLVDLDQSRLKNTLQMKTWLFHIALAALGLALPTTITILYLLKVEAWGSFVDITTHYWPLFGELSGEQRLLPTWTAKLEYRVFKSANLLSGMTLLVPAVYGFFLAFFRAKLDNAQRKTVLGLAAGAVSYYLYAFLAGRLWDYHLLPFMYFLVLLTALCLVDQRRKALSLTIAAIAMVQLALPLGPRLYYAFQGGARNIPQEGVVDEIAEFLIANTRPGDTVQPLDWAGGALNAMLIAKSEIATRFIYTYMFHHHVSHEYIQSLRREFIQALVASEPRYIIEMHQSWAIIRGPDTSNEFHELRNLLDTDYRPILEGNGYTLHEISPGSPVDSVKRFSEAIQ